jgi:signal transduction histidine kinase
VAGLFSTGSLVSLLLYPGRAAVLITLLATLLLVLTLTYTIAQQRGSRRVMAATNWFGGPVLGLIAVLASHDFLAVSVACVLTGVAYAVSISSKRMMQTGLRGTMLSLIVIVLVAELNRRGMIAPIELSSTAITAVTVVTVLGVCADALQRFWRFHFRIDAAITSLQKSNAELDTARTRLEKQLQDRIQMEQELTKAIVVGERNRLARELHDSVSQALFGIVLGTRTALEHVRQSPEQAENALKYSSDLAATALNEMRMLIFTLRPENLQNDGLLLVAERHITAAAQRYGVDIELKREAVEPLAALETKEAAYRIMTEALHNMFKHAKATKAVVDISTRGQMLVLSICDNGIGFDVNVHHADRFGLSNMRERAEDLGGAFTLTSEPGKGTHVVAELPLVLIRSRHP